MVQIQSGCHLSRVINSDILRLVNSTRLGTLQRCCVGTIIFVGERTTNCEVHEDKMRLVCDFGPV